MPTQGAAVTGGAGSGDTGLPWTLAPPAALPGEPHQGRSHTNDLLGEVAEDCFGAKFSLQT